jgi:transglutaminase-like putative cysteine protease
MKTFLLFISPVISSTFYECLDVNNRFVPNVPFPTLADHCQSVTEALRRFPSLPKSVIKNDVLPFTVLTEAPFIESTWRPRFQARARSIASQCETIQCISLEMNRQIYDITDPPIVFEAATANGLNSYSVLETLTKKKGSCTAMSVVLITALRMVGVPSRIVGVPHWNKGPELCPRGDESEECGNHNWVEVFVPDFGWSFIDQRRPDLRVLPLNQSWFYPDVVRGNAYVGHGNHSVYAVSYFAKEELPEYPSGQGVVPADHFPMVWDWENHEVKAWDVSSTYYTNKNVLEE